MAKRQALWPGKPRDSDGGGGGVEILEVDEVDPVPCCPRPNNTSSSITKNGDHIYPPPRKAPPPEKPVLRRRIPGTVLKAPPPKKPRHSEHPPTPVVAFAKGGAWERAQEEEGAAWASLASAAKKLQGAMPPEKAFALYIDHENAIWDEVTKEGWNGLD